LRSAAMNGPYFNASPHPSKQKLWQQKSHSFCTLPIKIC
jgi:hypothetical protein